MLNQVNWKIEFSHRFAMGFSEKIFFSFLNGPDIVEVWPPVLHFYFEQPLLIEIVLDSSVSLVDVN